MAAAMAVAMAIELRVECRELRGGCKIFIIFIFLAVRILGRRPLVQTSLQTEPIKIELSEGKNVKFLFIKK